MINQSQREQFLAYCFLFESFSRRSTSVCLQFYMRSDNELISVNVCSIIEMPTIEERENLLPSVKAFETGFTPRPVARQASGRRPRSLIDIECQHVLRSSASEVFHGRPSVEYRLWLEAGKVDVKPPSENPSIVHSSRCVMFFFECSCTECPDTSCWPH